MKVGVFAASAAFLSSTANAFTPQINNGRVSSVKPLRYGWEEYQKAMAGQSAASPVAPEASPAAPAAPEASYQSPVVPAAPAVPATSGATGTDPISTLDASQLNTVSKIAAAIPDLEIKPSLSWTNEPLSSTSSANLDARDAPGPANIAWLASVCVSNTMSSLTIFNGPLTDVPHLLSRCVVDANSNTMTFALDFRPRAYGAYELPESERGPDKLGRDAFTYSGNRKEYETKFVNEEVLAFLQSTAASFEGGVALSTDENEYESLTKGPFFVKVQMPITDANIASVMTAREKAADYWLAWALEDSHAHRPGAPINSQYVYDSKYRQNAYLALLEDYKQVFGTDGQKMSVAESGPLDEAYVGGGS